VTKDSAVVKARVQANAGALRLLVSEATSPGTPQVLPGEADAHGVVAFEIHDLRPATAYRYELEVSGAVVIGGRFRTFTEEPMSFQIVFGSCARTGSSHEIFSTMESLNPLFVLHMGDFHYENIDENDPARFRDAFDRVLRSKRQSSLYRSAPIVYIWDDHDYGANDADGTSPSKPAALAVYDEYVPHYPLVRIGGRPRSLQQAFTAGRVRFLITDGRSERTPDREPDGPGKSMLGEAQLSWLFSELEAARDRYALVVWVNTVPWITEKGSPHGWGRYDWERRYIADRIRSLGLVNRMLMLSGDGHMVAIDDGTNSNFATDHPEGERGFPVVHAAPFDRFPRPKGGPYSHGIAARRPMFGVVQIQQFGLMEVGDDGQVMLVALSGRRSSGTLLPGMRLELRCDAGGCVPLENAE
jgi:phosphodiesterase/alkaline phosphatase D-like protein